MGKLSQHINLYCNYIYLARTVVIWFMLCWLTVSLLYVYWGRLLLVMLDPLTQLDNPCMLNYSQRQIHKQVRPRKIVANLVKKT